MFKNKHSRRVYLRGWTLYFAKFSETHVELKNLLVNEGLGAQ